MAPVLGSNSRWKRAKISSSMVDDTNAIAINPDSVSTAGSLSPGFQTPAAARPLRRSLRLSAASASASNNPNSNPNLSITSGVGSTSATSGASGKKRGRPGRGRPSVQKEEEQEKEKEKEKENEKERTGTGAKMGAGEGRRMILRSGSQIKVTLKGTTPNAEVANSSVTAPTTIARRRRGRPKRTNAVDRDHHQEQQEEKETVDGDGDGDDAEEEMALEGRLLSLRSRTGGDKDKGKSKGKPIVDKKSHGTTHGVGMNRFMDKGKAKMVVDKDSDSTSLSELGSDSDSDFGSDSHSDSSIVEEHNRQFVWGEEVARAYQGMPPVGPTSAPVPPPRREAQRNRAIELAPKFAFFRDEEAADSEGEADDESVPDGGAHDWPGPFSTAMKIIEEREAILRTRQEGHSSKGTQSAAVPISWTPSRDRRVDHDSFVRKPPSLQSLCIKVLSDNAHEIESLEALPDMVKSMLVPILCHARKMTAHHLSELARGSPVELQLSDCSWATDREFEDIFTRCDTSELKELQLDLCGRCLPDYILRSSLARAPNSLPSLTKLSLKGAYSLSNDGLAAIVLSAPLLSSLNLCQCSLLTSEGITHFADNQGPAIRELYIDNCQNVSAMSILPSLKKAKCLEVLSMAGIPSVSDKFIRELIPVCGSTIKELNFAGCSKLTSSAIKVIGENCPQLSSLDIRNLTRLKDVALGHLANGCRGINRLLLRRSSFSDEAIAAFVEASGTKLIELSLNNIDKVGHQTAIAISRRCCMCLQKLDLSFCRRMSDQALGLMVDCCSSLKTLKLFGCTQVTDVFLKGHSNFSVRIIGVGGNIFLGDIQNRDFL